MSELSKTLFELGLNNYRSSLKYLNTNLLFQALFNLVAFRIIRRDDQIVIPLASMTMPDDTLYYLVPVSLLSLWLRFGFQLNNIINLRSRTLAFIVDSKITNDTEWTFANKLFEDSLLIDGWFYFHRKKEEHVLEFSWWRTIVLLSSTYYLLVSITHASIIMIPIILLVDNECDIWLIFLLVISFIFLLASHYMFWEANKNFTQGIILGLAVLCSIAFWLLKL